QEAARVIQIAPEVVGKLEQEGEYTLRVRDVTSVHGSPDHVYQVLVRPQVPHVGPVRIQPEGPINLPAGAGRRLTIEAPWKEGPAGGLALSVEGLPPGVKAFVGANGTTIDLIASPDAPPTLLPQA